MLPVPLCPLCTPDIAGRPDRTMPSKIDDASNLRFLHACLQASDYTRIDYAKVAAQFGIQGPAARMRFARLRDSLGGKPKARKRNDTENGAPRKRKCKEGVEYVVPKDNDDDEELPVGKMEREGDGDVAMGSVRIKREDEEDEEDDVPLRLQRYGSASTAVSRVAPTVARPSHGLPRIMPYAYPQPAPQQQAPQVQYFLGTPPPAYGPPERDTQNEDQRPSEGLQQ